MSKPLTFPAARIAEIRDLLPTTLGSKEIRERIAEDILKRSVFSARVSNALFLDKIREIITQVADGEMNDATARLALMQTLDAVGYTPEGGFPDAPEGVVPPAVQGTIEDITSKRRLDLIIRTQAQLMRGAAQQQKGMQREEIRNFPAYELIRLRYPSMPRAWGGEHDGTPPKRAGMIDPRPRWVIAGGKLYDGRMIALKGDPVWGELGSAGNFDDALGVDFPPFAFNSGMGWVNVSLSEASRLGVKGPQGQTIKEWFAEERPVIGGAIPAQGDRSQPARPILPPEPEISVAGVSKPMIDILGEQPGVVIVETKATTLEGGSTLREKLEQRRLEREARAAERLEGALAR